MKALTSIAVIAAGTLFSMAASAAIITGDESAGSPLPSGVPYVFDETIGPNTSFANAITFTTDTSAQLGSISGVALELSGVSGFVGPFTISLYEGILTTGADTAGAVLVDTSAGPGLSNVPVAANADYTFVIEGLSAGTPVNIYTGAVAISDVPLPGAAWLFGSALVGLAAVSRRRTGTGPRR